MYLGNPAVAVPPLDALHGAGHEVVLVLTSPDRRPGRRKAPTPTPGAARAAVTALSNLVRQGGAGAKGAAAAAGALGLARTALATHADVKPEWKLEDLQAAVGRLEGSRG